MNEKDSKKTSTATQVSRREFLGSAVGGAAVIGFSSIATFLLSSCGRPHTGPHAGGMAVSVIEGDFLTALPTPALITEPKTLAAQITTHTIFKGKTSRVLGYQSGSILGPTIVVNSGTNVSINFENKQIGRASCRERV